MSTMTVETAITPEMFRTLYEVRPFATRNADTLALNQLSDIFIEPTAHNSFACQDEIVKGRMGSGKTMYLRANYAHHRPSPDSERLSVLPVYVCLSSLPPVIGVAIYQEILIRMVEEICTEFSNLADIYSRRNLPYDHDAFRSVLAQAQRDIPAMRSCISKADPHAPFLSLSPNFQTVSNTFRTFAAAFPDPSLTLLVLLDEVGSVHSSFFRSSGSDPSLFETLMNQLRTCPQCSYKIGVYPHRQDDILVGTRYGQVIDLDVDITGTDYDAFISKCEQLIHRYVASALREHCGVNSVHVEMRDVFEPSSLSGEASNSMPYELAFAASGNFRRLVYLLDMAMTNAFIRHGGDSRISKEDIINAIKSHAQDLALSYDDEFSRNALKNISDLCRERKCFLFRLQQGAVLNPKLLFRNEEYQIITEYAPKTERHGPVYRLDYAYCLFEDIPTNIHHLYGQDTHSSEVLTPRPQWITTVIPIPIEYLNRTAQQTPMTKGIVDYLASGSKEGYIKAESGICYHFRESDLVNISVAGKIQQGSSVIFLAGRIGDDFIARSVDVLNA